MSRLVPWLRAAAAAFATLCALHAVEATPMPDQSGDGSLGAASCASSMCHGSIAPWRGSAVMQNEYVIWSRLDKHARAHATLRNEKSQAIASRLGLTVPAHEAAICVDCHAHNARSPRSGHQVGDGVTCEACHGPAERWIKPHVERGTTHQKNVSRGLYPTADPVARARLCLSCHFGTKDKYVTHRVMAAGHPRLSFELETFTHLQPAHFRVDADYTGRKGEVDGVKIWAVGQAIAIGQQMDLLLDGKRGRDGIFPELTLFDCHACHHPMSQRRWKSEGAFGRSIAPGLVRLNESGALMLRLILRQLDPALGVRFEQAVRRLQSALAGDGSVLEQARDLKALSETATQTIAKQGFGADKLRAVALLLVDDGLAGHYSDYAGAEQAVMALGSVVNTLHKLGVLPSATLLNQGLANLRAGLVDDEAFQPADFQSRLRAFRPIVDGAGRR